MLIQLSSCPMDEDGIFKSCSNGAIGIRLDTYGRERDFW